MLRHNRVMSAEIPKCYPIQTLFWYTARISYANGFTIRVGHPYGGVLINQIETDLLVRLSMENSSINGTHL